MSVLPVRVRDSSYEIQIERGCLAECGERIKRAAPCRKFLIVTDENVAPLYGKRVLESLERAGIEARMLTLPAGEETKSLLCLQKVYDALCFGRLSRTDGLIALGGGVIGDLCGLAAATYLRGVRYVQILTSLLAQVDSSAGGKVAVNLPQGKNLVGAFYQPAVVLIDPDTLKTLPGKVWSDGMGEVIKYGCIRDAALFQSLLASDGRDALMKRIDGVIFRCLELKREVVEKDERDAGDRMILNFGHTLGHAIEASQHYQGLRHGEAVAAGMYWITRLSEEKGLTVPGTSERILKCLTAHGLSERARIPAGESLLAPLRMDKKNLEGELTVVLLKEIGSCYLYKTSQAFFQGVEAWMT